MNNVKRKTTNKVLKSMENKKKGKKIHKVREAEKKKQHQVKEKFFSGLSQPLKS